MAGKHFVGADYADFTNSGLSAPVSRVTMMIDAETALTAGDDSGYEMKSECPFATQEMVEALLARVRGYRFQMFSAEAARLDPAAELGDAVDIGGVHAIISHRSDDGGMFPDISAVGEAELEDEYPTEGPLTREFNQKIAQTRSLITKTADRINLRIEELGKSTAEDLEKYAESVTKSLGELQSQIDGNIMTWFYDYEPTTKNEPASLWTTDAERIKHLGDVFYIVKNPEKSGQAYRWTYIDGQYGWERIEDVELSKALADAARAQDTADKKRRVFVEQPTPPYDAGDLWAGGPGGDMMRCKTARESGNYDPADWEKASKYTDDSFASEKYAELDLKIGTIKLEVANGDTKSSLTLKVGETVLSSADIILKGVVTFEGLRDGTTVIDGGWVNTDNLNLKGKITWGDLSEAAQKDIVRSSNFKTYLDNELVASPKIAGGKFMNLAQDTWVEITSRNGMAGLSLESTHWSGITTDSSVFGIYDGDFGNVSLSAKGFNFMMTSTGAGVHDGTVQAFGTWNFSNAEVTGLDSSAADYVTEQGDSGGWTYRKWNSGVAECWRTETAYNVAVTNQWGNIYVSNAATFGSKAYPFRFTSAPSVQVSPENANGDWWVATKAGGNASTSPGYQVCRGTENSNMSSCRAHFYVIGQWK